jgi:hypothetical protein
MEEYTVLLANHT